MKEETANPKPLWALARKEPGCRRYDMYASEHFIRIRRLLDIPGVQGNRPGNQHYHLFPWLFGWFVL